MDEAFARGGGRLSVEQFMQMALYDESHGYYSNQIKTVGRRGDFSTTATLHPALGEAVASWLEQSDVIEIGGGDGALAESVLGAMGWLRRRKVTYHLVETSSPLVEQQKGRLAKFGRRVVWHTVVDSALEACGGNGDIFSNELVDAFPATCLRWDSARQIWDEVLVRRDGSEDFEATDYTCDWEARDGQRIERHLSYRDWLAGWLPKWSGGKMLTIDYGDRFPDLYWRRPAGTLRAYFAQTRLDGLAEFFQRAGRQDLTADVNFSELMAWGQEIGLAGGSLKTQRKFFLDALPGLEKRASKDPALAFLLSEGGAGGAFQVLEQARAAPTLPC